MQIYRRIAGRREADMVLCTRSNSQAKEWGPDGIEKRFSAAWSGFALMLDQWLTVTEGRGRAAIREAYLDTLNGRVPPELGHILALAE